MNQSYLFLTENEIASNIAEAVKAYRLSPRAAHMTQAELAKKAGVSRSTITRFESSGAITLENMIAIFKALGLLQNIETLVPRVPEVTPMEALEAERGRSTPKRVRKPTSGDDNGSR